MRDYSVICPIDPQNPFQNPTEEPDYSPGYNAILPELSQEGCALPLFPTEQERSGIRRYYSYTFLALLFALFTSLTVQTALRMLLGIILRQIDLRALGTLPQNYDSIVEQYINDSAIGNAVTLLSFLIGNFAAFFVGCRLTGISAHNVSPKRVFAPARTLFYTAIGLWIQLLMSFAGEQIIPRLRELGLPLTLSTGDVSGSAVRVCLLGLYMCLVAPVTEELLFRGIVLKNLCRVSQRTGIVLSAFLFGAAHMNLAAFLVTFPLGLLLAYITVHHNSVKPAVAVHMAVNAMSFLQLLGKAMLPAKTFTTADQFYSLAVLGIGTICIVYFCITERMPISTPHQATRGERLLWTTPLLPVLLGCYVLTWGIQTFL